MPCEKKGYDKKQAQTVLNRLRKSKRLPYRPKRIYQCPDCGKYHITSKPKNNRPGAL